MEVVQKDAVILHEGDASEPVSSILYAGEYSASFLATLGHISLTKRPTFRTPPFSSLLVAGECVAHRRGARKHGAAKGAAFATADEIAE